MGRRQENIPLAMNEAVKLLSHGMHVGRKILIGIPPYLTWTVKISFVVVSHVKCYGNPWGCIGLLLPWFHIERFLTRIQWWRWDLLQPTFWPLIGAWSTIKPSHWPASCDHPRLTGPWSSPGMSVWPCLDVSDVTSSNYLIPRCNIMTRLCSVVSSSTRSERW